MRSRPWQWLLLVLAAAAAVALYGPPRIQARTALFVRSMSLSAGLPVIIAMVLLFLLMVAKPQRFAKAAGSLAALTMFVFFILWPVRNFHDLQKPDDSRLATPLIKDASGLFDLARANPRKFMQTDYYFLLPFLRACTVVIPRDIIDIEIEKLRYLSMARKIIRGKYDSRMSAKQVNLLKEKYRFSTGKTGNHEKMLFLHKAGCKTWSLYNSPGYKWIFVPGRTGG